MASIWSDPHHQHGHIPSRSNNHGPAGQEEIATQPVLYNVIQGCPCSWCSRNGYNPQSVGRSMEYQDPYGNQNLGGDHPTTVVATVDGQSQVWTVAPQALVCCLKSSSIRVKRTLGMHLCLTQWTLSRSKPVRSLIRLRWLIYRSRSVFAVLLGAMSTILSRSLVEFTWSQGPQVDSKSSLP
ncbi:hypothetical protein BGY98DRAFT_988502 [Russula aff. rugulosa BPL654]|nr:hypothetical protein BGY98DRAFT_988502 [Russula aff. rugulosa BPL654]